MFPLLSKPINGGSSVPKSGQKPVQLQLSAQNGGVDRQKRTEQITDKLSGQNFHGRWCWIFF